MAGAGAKKRLEENRKHLKKLMIWMAVGFFTYLFVRLLFYGKTASTWVWLALGLTSLVNWVCYSGISALAAPIYGEKGELQDGGNDLSMGGFCGYYHDLLYITSIVQVGASFFNWFWYVYLVVPCYGLYKLGQHVIVPWLTSGGNQQGPVMDEETKKKLERAEKRAQRRAQKWR